MIDKNRVLVVDDEETLRIVLSDELAREGYEVTTATDGKEAIASIQTKKFDVAILDVKMPNVDGYEVLKFAKKNFPLVRVIMLTAHADLGSAIEAKKHGADDFIEKPYDLFDLFSAIERVLNM